MAKLKTTRTSTFAYNYEPYSDCIICVRYTVYCTYNKRYKKHDVSFFDTNWNFLDDCVNDYLYRQFQSLSELAGCKLKDYDIYVSAIENGPLCGYHCDSINSALLSFYKDLGEVISRA